VSLDPVKVGLAVQHGLSVVCSTCTRYWEGRDHRLPEPQCTAKDGCASPLGGDDFHEYAGPLADLARWCFRCGQPSGYLIVLADPTKRRVGVCAEHVSMFSDLRPVTGPTPDVRLRGPDSLVRPQDLVPRRRRSLVASIMEVERYYADKDGREF
jgi:hypothetical protein